MLTKVAAYTWGGDTAQGNWGAGAFSSAFHDSCLITNCKRRGMVCLQSRFSYPSENGGVVIFSECGAKNGNDRKVFSCTGNMTGQMRGTTADWRTFVARECLFIGNRMPFLTYNCIITMLSYSNCYAIVRQLLRHHAAIAMPSCYHRYAVMLSLQFRCAMMTT